MSTGRRMFVGAVIAAMLAAGCTSSSDDSAQTGDTGDGGSATTASTTAPVDSAAPVDTDAPAGSEAPDDTVAPVGTDGPGVSPDTIQVGIVAIDFVRLAEAGVDQNRGDAAATYTAAIEAINDRGGIGGRMLEVITETYLPVGNVEAEETCLRLTEDRQVFVAVGSFRQDQVLCYTELHDTAAIAVSQQTEERLDRSTAPYISVRSRIDTGARNVVAAMDERGLFDGRTVGLMGFADADETLYRVTLDALRDAGVDAVEGLVPSTGGDVTAAEVEVGVVTERFESAGVDLTVHASPVANGLSTSADLGYETEWVQIPYLGPAVLTADGLAPAYLDGMLSVAATPVGTIDQEALADDPAVAECVAIIEAGSDERIDFSLDPEVDNLTTALNACGVATILEMGLTAAGPTLNNDTLAAAFAGLGSFDMAGFAGASLGPDKFDAADRGPVVRFSGAEGVWVPTD